VLLRVTQVLPKNSDWVNVPYIPDAYVINLGDLMSRWTNDKWVSTLHRVVTPPLDAGVPCRRQSMAFFHNINADHVVECIPTCKSATNPAKYPPIVAFDHLMEKHLASMGYK
jgi:isopenicillin N synthase-like dioxygenase